MANMIDRMRPDMAFHDDPANDNERRAGPRLLTSAGIAALCIVALAGLSPLILLVLL